MQLASRGCSILTEDRSRLLVLTADPHRTRSEQGLVNLWRGKVFSRSALRDEMLAADLTKRIPALRLPAYFLHGRHDYTVAYELSRAYVRRLAAPLKGFYTFEHSAHSPMFEEPDRTLRILRDDVLRGRNDLADAGIGRAGLPGEPS